MSDPLEAELDQLFQLPPGELVAARNALADRLRKAGDRAGATRIKALKRPTPAAWALNQVHFKHAALLDRARAATAQLRELHQGGAQAQQLSTAIEAQRQAIYAVIDAATRCCQAASLPGDGAQQRRLYTTLQAWLAGTGDEAPGRMTHDIEASGFEAVAALGLAPARPVAASAAPTAPQPASPPVEAARAEPPRKGPDPRAVERATTHVTEREQQARAATAEVERLRSAAQHGQLALERAQEDLRHAEEALRALRAQLSDREAAVTHQRAALKTAEESQRLADQALADAQAALSELQQPGRGH